MSIHAWSPVQYYGTDGKAPFVLICEHAAKHIPAEYKGLGLDSETQISHAAWDIGALNVAMRLSQALDAPLVAGGVSRLVYDLNRPLEAPDSMPEQSEVFSIPGNRNLSQAQREERFDLVHEPFHYAVKQLIDLQSKRLQTGPIVITIHSFTPIYRGAQRDVELGFLYHKNARLSEALQAVEVERNQYAAALNEPYDADDGVTYSLRRHAEDLGLDTTMIEVRNDLIRTEEQAKVVADHLSQSILRAQAIVQAERKGET